MFYEQFVDIRDDGFEPEGDFLADCTANDGRTCGGGICVLSDNGTSYHAPVGHTLITGTTGSGKTRRVLVASILNALDCGASCFVLDVKGELYSYLHEKAERLGYDVHLIDLKQSGQTRNVLKSRINPLYQARRLFDAGNTSAAYAVIKDIIGLLGDTMDASSADPYWRRTAQLLIEGVAAFIHNLYPKKEITFGDIFDTLNEIPIEGTNGVFLCIASSMQETCPNAYLAYQMIKDLPEKTRGCVLGEAYTMLSPIAADDIRKMTSGNDIDYDSLTARKSIVFFCISDESDGAYIYADLLTTQIYRAITAQANNAPDLRLKKPFHFFLDEVANAMPIALLPRMLSMSRSRNIFFTLSVQSLRQLDARFTEANASTIIANCPTLICLYTADTETWSRISKMCGLNPLGEILMTESDISRLKLGQGIVIRLSHGPFFTRFEDFTSLASYQCPSGGTIL